MTIHRVTLAAGLLLALATFPLSATTGVEAVTTAQLTISDDTNPEHAPEAPPEQPNSVTAPKVAGNYVFATTTTGSLTDMSTGTTTLLADNIDNRASALTDIGFEFYFQGERFTQFSINDNGVLRLGAIAQTTTPYQPLGQANLPLITAFGASQRTHAGDGKVHYRVSGTAPSRVLTVEWLNNQAYNSASASATADLTYQVQLREGIGAIEFIYGRMSMNSLAITQRIAHSPHIGFSSSNLAGTIGSVDAPHSGTPVPNFSSASATAVANLYNVLGPITVLTSDANGSRRTFSFTPPVPTAPTALNFTAASSFSMTLNWTDSPDELRYAIYNSTDGINFNFFATAPQNATSLAATGLTPNTNYTWRVLAVSEGALSTALSGTQATPPLGNVTSTGVGGNWSDPATWVGGAVPTDGSHVTIAAGATVTIDTAAVAYSLSIASNGVLQWETTTARSLTVETDVTIDGFFQSQPTGTVTTHVLSVGGNLTNNNTLDFATAASGAGITFTGSNNATFGGNGGTTDIRAIVMNKGTSNANTLELATTSFTVQGVAADADGFLTLTNGTFKLSGTFAGTNRVFTAAAYSIPATTGFWLDNPNYTVAAQNDSATVSGRWRISQGTYNIGTASGNSLGLMAGANVTVEGGAINAAGRFGVTAGGNPITYLQTGGVITVSTVGNTSTTICSYDLGNVSRSSITITGGTVIVQLASTAAASRCDYRNEAGARATGITGGTVQFGNASSGPAQAFNALGAFPDLVVNTASAAHSVTLFTTRDQSTRNLTINTGGTLNTGNGTFLFNGSTITNNGTLTSNGANSRFVAASPATNVTYQGTGVVTAPMTSLELQNDLNFTFDPAVSNVVVNRVILFNGNFVNANKLTLGNGGSATVQIGNTTTPTAGGSFDVAPAFDLGASGVQNLLYLRTTRSRSTGPEVVPTRVLGNLTYDDNDATHTLTLAGGGVTVNGTLALTNGRVIVPAPNTVTLGSAGTTTRTNGYVDGKLAKPLVAAASRTFEVGTANGYSPIVANVTAGTFPLTIEGSALQLPMPNFAPLDKAINRHWLLLAPAGTTADLTFNYLDTDIPGTAAEANLRVYNGTPVPPTSFTDLGGTLNTTANTGAVSGVTQFYYFTLAETGGGTPADLTVSKTNGVTATQTGATLTYTIVASNAGSLAVNGATVSEVPGPDLTCGTWTCTGAGGGTCTASGTGTISDTVNLPAGGSTTYTQQCTVATVSAAANVSNTARIAMPAGFIDTVPANNTATDTDTLTRLVNASISKTDGVTTVGPGASVTYTIVARNSGPNVAAATVNDPFPASLNSCAWTCAGSGGATCGAANGNGNIADTGSIPSGGTLTYTAACTLAQNATGTLANTATITVGSGESDTDASNNSATDTDSIGLLPDAGVTISDNRQFVRVGDSLNYIITVTNTASPLTASVNVSSALPSELGAGSWVCTPSGGATCAAGSGNTLTDTASVPANGQVAYVYSTTVQPGSPDDVITNTANVTSTGDPNSANNSATDTPADVIVLFKDSFEGTPNTIVPQDVGNASGYVAGRLQVDPQLLDGLDLSPVAIATAVTERGAELFTLELARFGNKVMLRSVLRDANGMAERSAWIEVDPARAPIAFAWQAASADASDGYLRIEGGGTPQQNGSRSERGRLALLRPAVVQGAPWVTLISGN
ncbi:MAG: DUF11 domain-containing protein [Rhodanobacteraceae bacterium]|nr:DUF11 domain-containing protein [Rhodanobacteraceae bacterium]